MQKQAIYSKEMYLAAKKALEGLKRLGMTKDSPAVRMMRLNTIKDLALGTRKENSLARLGSRVAKRIPQPVKPFPEFTKLKRSVGITPDIPLPDTGYNVPEAFKSVVDPKKYLESLNQFDFSAI